LDASFNEAHVLAITQALCDHRRAQGVDGPLFMGLDTHALSAPAAATATEVLAANGIELRLAEDDDTTPTPAVSLAILAHNRGRNLAHGAGLADGIVITPSHNPPRDGGFKYNPPHGGPAGQGLTRVIESAANAYLEAGLIGVKRMPLSAALRARTTSRHDFRGAYVRALAEVIDLGAIRSAGLRLGVDPLGGAGVHYWAEIGEQHGLNLIVVSDSVDPQFAFMSLDADGLIRMDPSSPWAMQRLVGLKDHCDLAFACDTDHDRHGIVTPSAGLMAPNDFLCVAVDHLFRHRSQWTARSAVGKTVVSTQLIDRVAGRLGRAVFETPVGFKWFSGGLLDGSLGFAGEESAGASLLRCDGSPWTTDKDGIALALLAAEITAVCGQDPSEQYGVLTQALGRPAAQRLQLPLSAAQRSRWSADKALAAAPQVLAGETVTAAVSHAPGNGEPLDGVKVSSATAWFAARPSGTEPLCKLYAETFAGPGQLQCVLAEAQTWLQAQLGPA
jgi:phosphoglucomutase